MRRIWAEWICVHEKSKMAGKSYCETFHNTEMGILLIDLKSDISKILSHNLKIIILFECFLHYYFISMYIILVLKFDVISTFLTFFLFGFFFAQGDGEMLKNIFSNTEKAGKIQLFGDKGLEFMSKKEWTILGCFLID